MRRLMLAMVDRLETETGWIGVSREVRLVAGEGFEPPTKGL